MNKNFALIAIACIAAVLPLAAAVYFIGGHGGLEDVFDYAPSMGVFFMLAGSGAAVVIAFFIAIRLKSGLARLVVVGVPVLIALVLAGAFVVELILPGIAAGGPAPKIDFIRDEPKTMPIRFAAAGDAHIGNPASRPAVTRDILALVGRGGYDLFFFLGDLPDHGFDDGQWHEALKPVADLSRSVPVRLVPGNHDTMYGGERLYRTYVLPDGGGSLWRRIDRGDAHFLVLDLEWETQTLTREEEAWLVRQLESIPRRDWCIVLCHTFFYCSGRRKDGWNWFDNKKTIERLTPLFERYGVDLVLSGHMHQTEVLRHGGVTYAVVGSAGGLLDSGRTYVSPASLWYAHGVYGFADVALDGRTGTLAIRDAENKVLFSTDLSAE